MIIDNNMPEPEIPVNDTGKKLTREQTALLNVSTQEKIKNLEELLEFVKESPESFEHLGGADEIRRMIEENLAKFRAEGA
jgi:hypothetical protein